MVLVIFLVFPLIAATLGIAGYFIFRNNLTPPLNILIAPIFVFVASLIFMFTVAGNDSFMIWVVLYTLISLATGALTLLLNKLAKK
ncbi:DUF2651 family protein [Bacillus atrophaeus]|nr:DUF2651 family protein [Bacillus atrophaeus]MBU5262198.1 DUF2651 family protein [Bacillus atrophaeus]MCY8467316.1 DUF2651 family protein [Bacillus atrophaeus]MCY8479936.1 DUF2651 family protein [Bacillus atrophaeus]MED1125669.1 DUF2651 family protein [Bacillus atrophaeus]